MSPLGLVLSILAVQCIDQTDVGQTRRANRYRTVQQIDEIVLHRFGPEIDGKEIEGVADAVAAFDKRGQYNAGSYTAGKMAYHFLYDLDTGTVYQALELDRVGVHAIGWNTRSVGVALMATKDESLTCSEDWERFYDFMASLRAMLMHQSGNWVRIHGHTELPGAFVDPHKVCPGHGIRMRTFREKVYSRTALVSGSFDCLKEET